MTASTLEENGTRVQPGKFRFLLHRLVRICRYQSMLLDARLKYRFPGLDHPLPLSVETFRLWSRLAAVPGHRDLLPWSSPESAALWADPRCSGLYQEALDHRLPILSAGPVDVSRQGPPSESFLGSTAGIPEDAIASYTPIDWHRDHHSGYRWDESEIYFSSRAAPRHGVEIKVPWELSKFMHVGILASGDLETGGTEFILQVLDWIDSNPPRTGVNWTSTLVVALRAINWIWGLRLFEPVVNRYPKAVERIIRSIHSHGRHIEKNLDYYVDRTDDHYIGDISGLIYIGSAFPDFPESDRWLLFGLQELQSEMERQVYKDGYHQMMSTGYHRFVTELFASTAALAERVPEERRLRMLGVDPKSHRVQPPLRATGDIHLNLARGGRLLPLGFYERLGAMVDLTVALTKPNGFVPQFGDNDSARAHRLLPGTDLDVRDQRHLAAVAGHLLARPDLIESAGSSAVQGLLIAGGVSPPVTRIGSSVRGVSGPILFRDSQIAVHRKGAAFLAVTCGPTGMGGHGGHGHNDRLSFELNLGGIDVVLDGGCPSYTAFPETRNRFRSTAAHSTIHVEGQEQNPWSPGMDGLFSLPERIRPKLEVTFDGAIQGEHYGFSEPHRRCFRLEGSSLLIEDELDIRSPRTLNFNLAPDVECSEISGDGKAIKCILRHKTGLRVDLDVDGVDSASISVGCFSLGYGVPVQNRMLSMRIVSRSIRTRIGWSLP